MNEIIRQVADGEFCKGCEFLVEKDEYEHFLAPPYNCMIYEGKPMYENPPRKLIACKSAIKQTKKRLRKLS